LPSASAGTPPKALVIPVICSKGSVMRACVLRVMVGAATCDPR
jgi:hypothetical protein